MTNQLHRLSIPFPEKYIESKQGADYVSHAIVNQRILGTLGPFDMHIAEVIRGDIPEITTGKGPKTRVWPAQQGAIVGVVLTCIFTIDGERVTVSEIGEPEGYYMAAHDGERLKKAVSDAFKRCAMRVGVGLHLWSKGTYFLPQMLEDQSPDAEAAAPAPDPNAAEPDDVHKAIDDEPHTVTDDGEIIEPETDAKPVTEAQLKRLGILQSELEMERDDLIENWVKPFYRVDSRKDLTHDQASDLINRFQAFVFKRAVEACDNLTDLETLAKDIKKAKLTGEPRRKLGIVYKQRKDELGDVELDDAWVESAKTLELS